tara:strand:- start:2926 stop:3339 length:414 start_codon:yes stop_codon:yes gene_type:complete
LKKKIIYVSVVALIDWQGKVLISSRTKKKTLPSYWEFPGGKIKNNEMPEDAIVREVKEELSIEIDKQSLKGFNFNTYSYEKYEIVIFFYICKSWKGTPKASENQKILWVEINNLQNYKSLPANKKFISELKKFNKKS